MNYYHNMPVLITGGLGFIGSHLAMTLLQLGARVTILDNGHGIQNNKILNKLTCAAVVINKSITDPQACLEATKNKKIVFHTAAFVSVPLSIENPRLCNHSNVEGTFNMLEASRLQNIERFIFSSSAAVYGPQQQQCTESMPCNPESPYGYSKLVGELYCKQYATIYGLPTVSLRYFNVWGSGQNPHGPYAAVVAAFREHMKHNKPITIFGDGTQTRDYIPVEHVVQANLIMGSLPATYLNGDRYNIASGTSITLLELIDLLKKEFPQYTNSIIFEPPRAGDLKHSAADCSKYRILLQSMQ